MKIKIHDIFGYEANRNLESIKKLFSDNYPYDTNSIVTDEKYTVYKDLKDTPFYVGEFVDLYSKLACENKCVGVIENQHNKLIAIISYKAMC